MTIGATEGKEPDHIDDADLLSLDDMRGAVKDLTEARLSQVERATVQGVLDEMEILKQMRAEDIEQMNRIVNLYEGLRKEFDQFRNQRVLELQSRGGGSTTPGE